MDPDQSSISTSHSFRTHDSSTSEKLSLANYPRPSLEQAAAHQHLGLAQIDPSPTVAHDPTSAPTSTTIIASSADPPPFSSHNFPSLYYPEPDSSDHYAALLTDSTQESPPPAFAPAPPFEDSSSSSSPSPSSSAVAVTVAVTAAEPKAPQSSDPKDRSTTPPSKSLDDGEPPPPYTEGTSPLDAFTYVMSAAGGAASILTQVQQGGPAPINTLSTGTDEHISLDLRYLRIASECTDSPLTDYDQGSALHALSR